MPHVHQVPVCKHQHSRHSLATPASQLPRDHATWTTPPDSPAREIQNDGPSTTARQYQCPYIEDTKSIMIYCTHSNASQAAARHATHGHHNCRVPKASPLSQRSRPHKTMRHLPRVAPSKIQCTNPNASQAAARHATHGHHNCRVTSPLTALPASQNNETPTTCSAVQHTMYKSKCLPGRSQACKPRPP